MARKKDLRTGPEVEDEEEAPALPERDKELSDDADIRDALLEVYDEVASGFQDQYERSNKQMDYWDIYNCILGGKQFYSGSSKIFVPIVNNAVNARKTRFTNQIFPVSGRNVDCTSSDGSQPHGIIALLEDYIRRTKLRTEVMPALCKNGDVEGQYNLYVSWKEYERFVAWRVKKPAEIDGIPVEDEEIEDIQEDELEVGCPAVEVLADSDVLVLPFTADSIEEALEVGGSVTVVRRWSKARVRKAIDDEEITKEAGESLLGTMKEADRVMRTDKAKKMIEAAGIITANMDREAPIFEVWTKVIVDGERRIVRAYFGCDDNLLGCKRNPYWSDKIPVLSCPVEKVQGSFKGMSKVGVVADLQYQANDATNEAMDSAAYALMPIVMTDPEKNPRVGSMILSMAAIWETSPKDTQFAQFPPLWKDGLAIVSACKNEIFQSLAVTPAAITTHGMDAKLNQAELAQEQQVDILNTADAVTVLEQGILTPLLSRFVELDHQYRERVTSVRQYGELGSKATMEEVEPIQFDRKYQFTWFGVEAARSAQQMQQQMAGLNVISAIPPEQLNGYRINLVPVVTQFVENTFGPRLAPLVFVSPEDQLPVPVQEENMLLTLGFEPPTHEMDDDDMHIQAHLQAMQMNGGENAKKFQTHVFKHMQQKARKQQLMSVAQAPGAAPASPPAGAAGPPRAGAVPAGPRQQGPAGMIHRDQIQDPGMMPRKMG